MRYEFKSGEEASVRRVPEDGTVEWLCPIMGCTWVRLKDRAATIDEAYALVLALTPRR